LERRFKLTLLKREQTVSEADPMALTQKKEVGMKKNLLKKVTKVLKNKIKISKTSFCIKRKL